MKQLKVLAIAVATGRIGYVFLKGKQLRDWGLSRKASKSPELAAKQAQTWINELKPDVVVTEKIEPGIRKGGKSKELIAAIARVAEQNYLLDVSVQRMRHFKDKYTEAIALAEEFPELLPWVPKKRRIWEPEPRNTVYFEALALVKEVLSGPDISPSMATA